MQIVGGETDRFVWQLELEVIIVNTERFAKDHQAELSRQDLQS